MKSALLGLIAALAFTRADDKDMKKDYSMFHGTYEFEIMGSPFRMYLCECEDSKQLYWSVADIAYKEYTVAVGRDSNGIEYDGKSTYTAESLVFRLYGDQHLQGYYQIKFNKDDRSYVLRERFPELEDGQQGAEEKELWNQYEMAKLSPTIVGNPAFLGYQCAHPRDTTVGSVPIPSLWRSELENELDRLYDYELVSKDPINSCWKYEDVWGNEHRHGNNYAPDIEWDGSLLLMRWDDSHAPDHCYVGSQLIVMLEEDLALISYQCENRIYGGQFLAHLQKMTGKEKCPFGEEDEMDKAMGEQHKGGD